MHITPFEELQLLLSVYRKSVPVEANFLGLKIAVCFARLISVYAAQTAYNGRIKQIFAVAGKSLSSYYLANIEGYIGSATDTLVQQCLYCSVHSMSWKCVY
jgi:hypothetical protein